MAGKYVRTSAAPPSSVTAISQSVKHLSKHSGSTPALQLAMTSAESSSYEHDLSTILEDLADVEHDAEDAPNKRQQSSVSRPLALLEIMNEEWVGKFLTEMKKDKVLLLSLDTSIASGLTVKAAELLEKMRPMSQCFPERGRFINATKEEAWRRFQNMQLALVSEIDVLVKHKGLSAFILLRAMEELLPLVYQNEKQNIVETVTISSDERDIVSYVGGFVLFRCKTIYSSNALCSNYVKKCCKKEQPKGKLVAAKTRGGLCEPKDDIISFFVQCEIIFRQLSVSIATLSFDSFLKTVCEDEQNMSLFYAVALGSEPNTDIENMELLVCKILHLYFLTRCHAKCRQLFERYLIKTKSKKKQKALRKEVDN